MTDTTPTVKCTGYQGLTKTITIGTQVVRTRTPRRFIVVAVRNTHVDPGDGRGFYVPFIEVLKRTDNHKTAQTTARRYGHVWGAYATVVDTFQAEEC